MILILLAIFVISLIMAAASMKDLAVPEEIKKLIPVRRIQGRIVFFSNQIKHYSSSDSS